MALSETDRRPLFSQDQKPFVDVVVDNGGVLVSCDLLPVPLNKKRVITPQKPTEEIVQQAKNGFTEGAMRFSEQVGDIYHGKKITPGTDLLTSVVMKVHSVIKDETLPQEEKIQRVSGMFEFVSA